ncbi:MAG: bifunctional riboflavin kinase/FAD synthetase [Actinobacteria bacterium]|nr:bifunctional riboflavin kinase/FAD synthetase [Actinomycetota bacterium]MBM3712714.1 bifunctional riboflavin kinase/FAD synthetase [Actinomycetota bacterium]
MSKTIRLENLKKGYFNKSKVIAVMGFFDGIHIGHQKIIKDCIDRAEAIGGTSVVFTFDKPPSNIIRGGYFKKLITSYSDKLCLISQTGIDYVIVAKFDSSFADLEPEEFCRKILINNLNIKELFIGKGFRFGRDAKGDVNYLKMLLKNYKIKVNEVPILKIKNMPVSSTIIRKFYSNGDIENIISFLGRIPFITGKVIRGDSRGRIIGFPTANIDVFEKFVVPKDGVYFGWTTILKKNKTTGKSCVQTEEKLPSLINIGSNPTFKGRRRWIEAHIIDFNGDIYNEKIKVYFFRMLREEKEFKNKEELVNQIKLDLSRARKYFESH